MEWMESRALTAAKRSHITFWRCLWNRPATKSRFRSSSGSESAYPICAYQADTPANLTHNFSPRKQRAGRWLPLRPRALCRMPAKAHTRICFHHWLRSLYGP